VVEVLFTEERVVLHTQSQLVLQHNIVHGNQPVTISFGTRTVFIINQIDKEIFPQATKCTIGIHGKDTARSHHSRLWFLIYRQMQM